MERTARSPGDVAVIVVFALLLVVPALLALTGHAGFDIAFLEHTEHRRPFVAPPPTTGALATGGWERDAEREIADAFPLRKELIQGYNYAKYTWLGEVQGDRVIRGRDGWLFLGGDERTYLTDRVNPTDAALAHAADVYAARAAWSAQHGVHYVFVMAPNKSTIYPQYLPAAIARVTPTPADRLIPLLRARGVPTVDVRAVLIDASRHGDVYSKGDTHWNEPGAYIAYRAILAALRDAGVRDTIARATMHTHTGPAEGDLLGMSGVGNFVTNAWIYEDYPHRAHRITPPAFPNDPDAAAFNVTATAVDDPKLPTAVMFGDSFAQALVPFLAEDFRRMVHLDHKAALQFDRRIVTAERPTVVIDEQVERSLVTAAQYMP